MNRLGIVCALLSAVLMATIGVFSRFTGFSAEIVTFFRLFLGTGFMALFLLLKGDLALAWRWPGIPVVLGGGLLAGFILFYVQAMNFTTMANAIMIVYLAPFAASIAAHFFLGERLNWMGFGCIIAALFGFAMMQGFHIDLGGTGSGSNGLLLAGCALICYSSYILVNRMIAADVHVYTRTFWQLFIGACVAAPAAGKALLTVSVQDIGWLAAIGFFPGFLAILFAVIGLNRLSATLFGTLAYTEAVAVVIFGWGFFGEDLSILQIAGCAIIVGCGVLRVIFAEKSDTI